MSEFVAWIAAAADERHEGKREASPKQPYSEARSKASSWQDSPAHNFPSRPPGREEGGWQDDPLDRNPDLWLYRSRTVALLRRYLRFSLETGRLPSLVGREFFRAKVTYYTATTFEDRVIFVRDVEKSLDRLAYWDQQLIARVILQEHNHGEAAHILHCCRKTVERRLPEVLDLLSEDFLRVGLLVALPSQGKVSQ
jgi:hypothetical protein